MTDNHLTHNQPIYDPYQGLSWRDQRYRRFYEVVDKLVDEVQAHSYSKTGKPKRRLKNADLDKLTYSVECLVSRDCIAVVFQRKRLGEFDLRGIKAKLTG